MLKYLVQNENFEEDKTLVNEKPLKQKVSHEKKKVVGAGVVIENNLCSKKTETKHWTDNVKPIEFILHKDTFGQTSGGLRRKFLREACDYAEITFKRLDKDCLCWVLDKLLHGNTRVTCKQIPCKSMEELQSFFFNLCVGIPSYETFHKRLYQELRLGCAKRRFLQLWTDVERTRALIVALLVHQLFVKNIFVLKQNSFGHANEVKARLVAIHEHQGMEGIVRDVYKVMTWLFKKSCIDVVFQKNENGMMFEFCAHEGGHILYHKGRRASRHDGKQHFFNIGDPIPLEFCSDDVSTGWRLKTNLFSHFAEDEYEDLFKNHVFIENGCGKKLFSRIGKIDKINRPLPGFGGRRGVGLSSKNCWVYNFEALGLSGNIGDYCSLYTIFTFYSKVFAEVIQVLVIEFMFGKFPKADA
jgi:hypothetical protein